MAGFTALQHVRQENFHSVDRPPEIHFGDAPPFFFRRFKYFAAAANTGVIAQHANRVEGGLDFCFCALQRDDVGGIHLNR